MSLSPDLQKELKEAEEQLIKLAQEDPAKFRAFVEKLNLRLDRLEATLDDVEKGKA